MAGSSSDETAMRSTDPCLVLRVEFWRLRSAVQDIGADSQRRIAATVARPLVGRRLTRSHSRPTWPLAQHAFLELLANRHRRRDQCVEVAARASMVEVADADRVLPIDGIRGRNRDAPLLNLGDEARVQLIQDRSAAPPGA